MQVTVVGVREAVAKLQALPDQLLHATQDTTDRATNLEAERIRSDTPRRTGALVASEQTSVTKTADGARGRVFSDLRYASYVELGTAKHGAGQHMFQRGSQSAQAPAEDLYRAAIDEVAARAE